MLRSRNKSISANNSQSDTADQSEDNYDFKKYAKIVVQILIFCIVFYSLWLYCMDANDQPIVKIIEDSKDENIINTPNTIEPDGDEEFNSLPEDDCEWRPENLVGTCFGLKDVKGIESAIQCKESCCKDADCITWQYHKVKGCQNGGNVRFGLERASTPNWCEPTKPRQWNGKRIKNRSNGKCEWQAGELNTQCFGLGPEIKGIETMDQCEKVCCDGTEKQCEIWQFREDKGCFIGKSNNCDDDVLTYIGQRKVMPNGVFE